MVVIIIVFFFFSETKGLKPRSPEIKLARSYDDVALCN